jgi:hypothetical protein
MMTPWRPVAAGAHSLAERLLMRLTWSARLPCCRASGRPLGAVSQTKRYETVPLFFVTISCSDY